MIEKAEADKADDAKEVRRPLGPNMGRQDAREERTMYETVCVEWRSVAGSSGERRIRERVQRGAGSSRDSWRAGGWATGTTRVVVAVFVTDVCQRWCAGGQPVTNQVPKQEEAKPRKPTAQPRRTKTIDLHTLSYYDEWHSGCWNRGLALPRIGEHALYLNLSSGALTEYLLGFGFV